MFQRVLILLMVLIVGCSEPAAQPAAPVIPAEGWMVTVPQRQSERVPTNPAVWVVQINDISGGQTLLELRDLSGKPVIATRAVRQSDRVLFEFRGGSYELIVERLANLLMGEDYAELRFVAAGAFSEQQRIEQALKRIETSGLQFIRNGEKHAAPDAAEHLRGKLKNAGDTIATYDQFIEDIATKSSVSGKPYEVQRPDGSTVPLAQWLRDGN